MNAPASITVTPVFVADLLADAIAVATLGVVRRRRVVGECPG